MVQIGGKINSDLRKYTLKDFKICPECKFESI
jgi:hypothetical protein